IFSRRNQLNGIAGAENGGCLYLVGRRCPCVVLLFLYLCSIVRVNSNGARNVARSSTQGGQSFCSSLSMRLPAHSISLASLRFSPMFTRTKHEVFPSGLLQMVPSQPASCQGTRIEMCCVGSCRAPAMSFPTVTLLDSTYDEQIAKAPRHKVNFGS